MKRKSLAAVTLTLIALVANGADAPSRNLTAIAIQPFVDRHQLAGAVTLLVSKNKVEKLETAGFADVATGRKMRPDTVFWMASTSKPFLATAVMMLVDEGKVRLDDPVERYLPDYQPRFEALSPDGHQVLLRKPAHPPTVRNLLTHTGGTQLLATLEHWKIDSLPLSAKVDAFTLEPLEFEPDTKWSYSNEGFETAARMIEVISGMSFEDFMRRRVFDPLGMIDTRYLPTEAQEARLAKGYKPNAAGTDFEEVPIFLLQYPLANNPKRFASSSGGGLFSTGPDLARFCRMVLNHGELDGKRYLSEAAIHEMTRNQIRPDLLENGKLPGDTGWENYGLGWGLVGATYDHEGGIRHRY
jgi:CubicO group peptidase (beta-lactamase class C family)